MVVSHSNSTSNHNQRPDSSPYCLLFLIPILHQTTTRSPVIFSARMLFLIPILHQTTTDTDARLLVDCCFSFQFYIKPQQPTGIPVNVSVVSHSNSTSNHNYKTDPVNMEIVVSHSNSTSNHNYYVRTLNTIWVVSHSNSTSNHNLAHGSNSYSARYTYDTDA